VDDWQKSRGYFSSLESWKLKALQHLEDVLLGRKVRASAIRLITNRSDLLYVDRGLLVFGMLQLVPPKLEPVFEYIITEFTMIEAIRVLDLLPSFVWIPVDLLKVSPLLPFIFKILVA